MKLICQSCGTIGKPKLVTKGSIGIEIILWLLFLLPGLIYSIWRLTSKHKACQACGSTNLIPLETPAGKALVSKYHGTDNNDGKKDRSNMTMQELIDAGMD